MARDQVPTAPERDRSSVGGAHELSGTGAQSWRSADISCEHPVGGPCVSGPIRMGRSYLTPVASVCNTLWEGGIQLGTACTGV
ncbi:MAG: hypothetical protein K0Q46_5553 [Rhodococcus erythropolis]|nr:hypothetical protein [Rhodococcus erythropolis]MDF2898767.1 hypothetical protein [Rhodococcus erythropolis]